MLKLLLLANTLLAVAFAFSLYSLFAARSTPLPPPGSVREAFQDRPPAPAARTTQVGETPPQWFAQAIL